MDIFRNLWARCHHLFPWKKNSTGAKSNVSNVFSHSHHHYSPEKQKKLEALCESLFEQKELITAGKLQFLGLGKIKRKLGKSWPGLQSIVHNTAEEAIKKYLMPADIFIRYKDDTYVIIFANAGPEEAQIKATLVAEEIKRQLFTYEDEDLKSIEIDNGSALIPSKKLTPTKSIYDLADRVSGHININKRSSQPVPFPAKKITISPTVEVDPYPQRKIKAPAPIADNNPHNYRFSYLPLWNVKENILTTYLCLARQSGDHGDALDDHEHIFTGMSPSQKTTTDIQVLRVVAAELEEMIDDGRDMNLACPVHFSTLFHNESYQKYIVECQKIPDAHKAQLIFLLLDLPATVHESNIDKFSIPLKKHCTAIYAEVPLDTKVDFAMLRNCRFEAVGFRLKNIRMGQEKQLIAMMEKFANKARRALMKNIFALDVTSLSITTSAVCADYDLLGGSIVHDIVLKPDHVYRFKHDNLFSTMLETKIN